MRKKAAGRILSCVMAAAMVMGTLAGCGGSDAGSGAEGGEASQDAGESADGVETFTIATVRWTDAWPNDFMNDGIMKELEEKHNIKINWQVYYNSDWTEQKSLLLASGDLPDAFFGCICLT